MHCCYLILNKWLLIVFPFDHKHSFVVFYFIFILVKTREIKKQQFMEHVSVSNIAITLCLDYPQVHSIVFDGRLPKVFSNVWKCT